MRKLARDKISKDIGSLISVPISPRVELIKVYPSIIPPYDVSDFTIFTKSAQSIYYTVHIKTRASNSKKQMGTVLDDRSRGEFYYLRDDQNKILAKFKCFVYKKSKRSA